MENYVLILKFLLQLRCSFIVFVGIKMNHLEVFKNDM